MKITQIIKLYQKKKYPQCLVQLKKIYRENPYQPFLYLMFFVVYKKLKKRASVLKWLKQGFYLMPENQKIAELFAYYTVLYKKNPEEALIPLSKLTEKPTPGAFSHLIFSRFYYKKGDLERALFYSKAAIKENKSSFYENWYFFLLFKYNLMYDLRKIQKRRCARKMTGQIKRKDILYLKHPYEKRMALKEKGIILLNEKLIKQPLYQLEIYKKYGFVLPKTHPLVLGQILKEKNIDVLEEFEKKKGKKTHFFDENLIAKTAWFLIILVIVLMIWRTFW